MEIYSGKEKNESGAPNENTVQDHLNIALLNVLDIGIFLSPKNFSSVRIS